VSGLAPGPYSARVGVTEPNCFGPATLNLDLGGGESENPVTVAIGHGGLVQGTLYAGGRRLEEFAVALTPTDGSAAEVVTAGARGQFLFQNVRPGSYRIGAYRSNQAASTVTPTLDLQVTPGSSLDVTLPAPPEGK